MAKYYCLKCEMYHYRGKIYKNHLKYKYNRDNIKKKDISRMNEFDFQSLRPVARRQIIRLIRKMKLSKRPEFYKKQIKRVIIYESKNH